MFILIAFLFGLPSLMLSWEFIKYLARKKIRIHPLRLGILQIVTTFIYPLFYLFMIDQNYNDCCNESATFSPEHWLTIYVLISVCIITYFLSSFFGKKLSPVLEVITNSILLFGFVLNFFIAIQIGEYYWLFGNLPIGLLFLFQLIENHQSFLKRNKLQSKEYTNTVERLAWKILMLPPIAKFPLLLLLFLPILTIITSLLTLFGQRPDSLIRAFTDTYKHNFSHWDYMCENVQCGGHFLCSVAANGHKEIVNPTRYGERNGHKILCNRQLLVANAFEELIERKLPRVHKFIRSRYNKVGNMIHRHYHIFNNKFVSDVIYVLMKPLEWGFLLVLYTFDRKPENRIAQQYMKRIDRKQIARLSEVQ